MNFGQLYGALRDELGYDFGASTDRVKRWTNEAYVKLVVRSQWRKAQVEIATTVAGQAEYAVGSTVEDIIEGLLVGSTPYEQVDPETMWRLASGAASVDGPVWSEDYSAAGVAQVELFPAPTVTGDSIQALAVLAPADMTADADVPIVPSDFHTAIVDGAASTALRRMDQRIDEADSFETRFEGEIERLRRRANERLTTGPVQVQVAGFHF